MDLGKDCIAWIRSLDEQSLTEHLRYEWKDAVLDISLGKKIEVCATCRKWDTEIRLQVEDKLKQIEDALTDNMQQYWGKFKFNTELWGDGFERVACPDYAKAFHTYISSHFGENLHTRMAIQGDTTKTFSDIEIEASGTISEDVLPVTEE